MVIVRADAVSAGSFKNRPAETCVCSRIEVDLAVETCQYAVFVAAYGESAFHGMPLRMHSEGLLTAELHLHRPAELHCRKGREMLRGYVFLASEASAYQLVLNDHTLRGVLPSEHDAYLFARVKGALVCREYLYSVFVRERYRAFRLKEGVLCERCTEFGAHGVGCFLESLSRIAAHHVPLLAEIACRVHLCSPLRSGLSDVPYRLKRLVFDLHSLLRLLEYVRSLGYNNADGITCHSCDVALRYHYIPVLLYMPYFVVRHVRSGQHSEHSRKRLGFLLIDLLDYRPWIVRPYG